ncbi:MAG: hypothetical protein IJZ47_07990 [Oscillospiraceae bacterium]|nr:hypothetical protein [Oscillospiraceae bacterium]
MALKGQTKIQLFNAKTGELEQEVNETNMVTNAITNALNLPMDFYSAIPFATIVDQVAPIQTEGMAGVLVLDKNIKEDVNITSLPNDVNIVGNAGEVYSGTNTSRGTYNSNESKALSNGYRHVWDFASDRANGDISCVCLTHIDGGNCGLNGYDEYAYRYKQISHITETNINSNSFVGITDKATYCLANISYRTVTLDYYKGFNTDKVLLSRRANNSLVLQETVTFELSNAYFSGEHYEYWNTNSNGVIRIIGTRYVDGQYVVSVCKIDAINKVILLDKTFTLKGFDDTIYNINDFEHHSIMDNYCLFAVKMTSSHPNYHSSYSFVIVATDMDGNFIKEFNQRWSGKIKSCSYDTHDKILNFHYNTDEWVDENLNVVKCSSSSYNGSYYIYRYAYTYIDLHPYCLGQYGSTAYLFLDRTYLATINNLATTVTKTKEQTMKITYDITEV